MQTQNNNEPSAAKTGTLYCEKWISGNSLPDASVTQTITGLKDGDYLVTATCHGERQGSTAPATGVYLMAGDNRTAVTTTATYKVIATAIGGELTIGFGCENTDANWITVDNFKMKWIGSSAENNKATLLILIEKLQDIIDTKEILPQKLCDEAAAVISKASAAETDEEVHLAIENVTKKYEELDAYRIPVKRDDNSNAYLFAYFPNNNDENLYYALSTDGYNYTPLNNGQKILDSRDFTRSGGIRDPHILRGEDGIFRMVNTDMRSALGWSSNRGIVMSKSTDLIHWTHSTVHFPTRFPEGWSSVTRVWAPETVYDREMGKYMVYFSLLTSDDGTCNYDKVFYCYANDDFTDLEDYPVHLFDRGSATIDADIIFDETDQLYHMIYKNEGINSISQITAKYLTAREGESTGSQWGELGGAIQQTNVAVEGGGIFRLIDTNTYVVMYDCYGSGYYQFCSTTDWRHYTLVAQTATSGNFTPRHGSVTLLHPAETRALLDAFPTDGFDIDCGDFTGDVNGDGNVNGADIVAVINYVLADDIAGDVNGDGNVNGADIVAVINYVLNDSGNNARQTLAQSRAATAEEPAEILSGTKTEEGISLSLTGGEDCTAFQFMLSLPEGVSLTAVIGSEERLGDHELLFRRQQDGRYLVLGYAMDNHCIGESSGELLSLRLESNANGRATVSEALIFTPQAETRYMNALEIDLPTAVSGVRVKGAAKEGDIYDLNGLKLNKKPSSGYYIQGGNKYFVK